MSRLELNHIKLSCCTGANPGKKFSYLTAKEVGAAANLIAEATGSMKNPYLVKLFKPKECKDDRFESVEAVAAGDLLPYRTAARNHQLFAEIEKT